jgi:hypothetical protein
MADVASHAEPPTFYANFVTVSVDPDVLYMEVRRYIIPHQELYRRTKTGETAPPPETAAYAEEPIARIVLTYTAAKTLHASLSEMIPRMELARKELAGTK